MNVPVRYQGGLLCGLAPASTPVPETLGSSSLLATEEEPGALHSRGNFEPPALVGACANYPDYGLIRTFSLRGFRLTLRVSDVEVRPDYQRDFVYRIAYRKDFPIGRMKFTVSVVPDPAATSAKALPSPYIDPDYEPEACAKPVTEWPVLRNAAETVDINLRDPRTLVTLNLRDVTGQPRYQFVCFAGNDEASYEFSIIYTGGLQCGLAQAGTPVEHSLENPLLLTKDDTKAHFSRAIFHAEELVGFCADYPDYGLTRDYYLRGFRLTLRLSDVDVNPDYKGGSAFRDSFAIIANEDRSSYPIGHLKLTVTVAPDPKARSATALPSKYVDPKGVQEACVHPVLVNR